MYIQWCGSELCFTFPYCIGRVACGNWIFSRWYCRVLHCFGNNHTMDEWAWLLHKTCFISQQPPTKSSFTQIWCCKWNHKALPLNSGYSAFTDIQKHTPKQISSILPKFLFSLLSQDDKLRFSFFYRCKIRRSFCTWSWIQENLSIFSYLKY